MVKNSSLGSFGLNGRGNAVVRSFVVSRGSQNLGEMKTRAWLVMEFLHGMEMKAEEAECEDLQNRVEALSGENRTLRDELQRLSEECEKLTSENDSIKEELTRVCGPEAVSKLENHIQSRGDEGN